MFVLAEMRDTVRIKPWLFSLDIQEAVENKLNKKFANKVHNILEHLCIEHVLGEEREDEILKFIRLEYLRHLITCYKT